MLMIKLSVVVIIYKVEQYLNQCIDSILNQTYKNFELVLVDDGSPDNCPRICDEYAAKDSRIKVIHQENQGSVSARWNGFLNSTGEYISFIDGDDWIDSDMLERMISLADQKTVDMVIVGYKEVSESGSVNKCCPIESGYYSDDKIQCIYDKAMYTGKFYEAGINASLWNKLIKRSLLLDGYIPADYTLKMGDDAAVSYPAISRAQSIVIENDYHPYNYRIVNGSLSRAFDKEYFVRSLKLFEGLADNLISNKSMFSCIYPYSLFISYIGIYMLFQKNNGLKLKERKTELQNYYISWRKLFANKNNKTDLTVDLRSDKVIYLFSEGKLNMLVFRLYWDKIVRRLKRA